MGTVILPGKTIGIIGGGQLGKMLSIAAQTLGYRTIIWSEEVECPACGVASETIIGSYTDPEKLELFTQKIDIATVETEHIPTETLVKVEKQIGLYPRASIVATAQNRKKEKEWLFEKEFPVVPFQIVASIEDVIQFKKKHEQEIVVKTITGGYDGKGQLKIKNINDNVIKQIQDLLASEKEIIAEIWLPVKAELSVIAARNSKEQFVAFPLAENEHINHILHQTVVPARVKQKIEEKAFKLTERLMVEMDYVGLLCVEFFYGEDGNLYINELAPRPHNSGHYTLDATTVSQFEQTIRAICTLPLADTSLLKPAVMTNLLGDLWSSDFNPEEVLQYNTTKLHLYGKKDARPKRKMGHYTTLSETVEIALKKSIEIYRLISKE